MFPKKDSKLKPINDLFAKYKTTLKAPQGIVVTAFIEIVEDLFQYTIKKEAVRYSVHSKVLSLSVSSPLKTEILLHKKEILNHLKGRLGAKSSPNEIL